MRRPSGGIDWEKHSVDRGIPDRVTGREDPLDDTSINKNSRKVKSGACGNPAALLEFLIGWSRQSSILLVDSQVKEQTETSSNLLETDRIGELRRSGPFVL